MQEEVKAVSLSPKKKRRSTQTRDNQTEKIVSIYVEEFLGGLILALILIALGYDFISGSQGGKNAFEILWNSMVKLKGSTTNVSYGVLTMICTTWIIGSVVIASEIIILKPEKTGEKHLDLLLVFHYYQARYFGSGIVWRSSILSINQPPLSKV
jgi:hypothetical protein